MYNYIIYLKRRMKELKAKHELQAEFNVAIKCKNFHKARKILDWQCKLIGANTKMCIENQITLDIEETMNDEV